MCIRDREMIVPATFRDDFGQEVEITTTFLRYELEFQLFEQEFTADQVVRTIELVRENLTALTQKDARERHPWASEAFRKTAIKSTGGRPAFIKTTSENSIEVKSGRRGRNPYLPLKDVRSTVLSVYGRSADYPAIAAVLSLIHI